MSVTITLTDDQALEVMAQIANKLKKRPDTGSDISAVKATIIGSNRGKVFVTAMLAGEMGCIPQTVSKAFRQLKPLGYVEMVRRGTWRRL